MGSREPRTNRDDKSLPPELIKAYSHLLTMTSISPLGKGVISRE